MSNPLRAIYKNGQLHLLDPVDLPENQEIKLIILNEREQVRAALGDLVAASAPIPDDDELDEATLMREIQAGSEGVTLSDLIIEKRHKR